MKIRHKENRIKLFCFPYAGGSSVMYHQWKPFLQDEIELRPIELAGRGKRIIENPYNDIKDAVEDVFELIYKEVQQSPYMLFGHSMGAMIAYELAQKIREKGLPKPIHMFFSGKGAPNVHRSDEKEYHLLDDSSFKKEVIELGGTPPEFFEHPELMELFLPLLKNDFRIAETHKLTEPIKEFDQDITVLLGKEDDLNAEQCEEWVKHTTEFCYFHHFPGGHFFINDEKKAIVRIIEDVVRKNTRSLSPMG